MSELRNTLHGTGRYFFCEVSAKYARFISTDSIQAIEVRNALRTFRKFFHCGQSRGVRKGLQPLGG